MTQAETARFWFKAYRRARYDGIGPRALAAEIGKSVWSVKEHVRQLSRRAYQGWPYKEMAA